MLASALWELNGGNKRGLGRLSVQVWTSAAVAGPVLARSPGPHTLASSVLPSTVWGSPSWCDRLDPQASPPPISPGMTA